MLENYDNKLPWESPKLTCLDTKKFTESGIVILPIEILGVQGPLS